MTTFPAVATACRKEVLMAVAQSFEHVQIYLYNLSSEVEAGADTGIQSSKQIYFMWHQLSRECGDSQFRCQDLLVESYSVGSTRHTVVFLPLDGGLGLVDITQTAPYYRVEYNQQILRTDGEPQAISCSPSAVFKILDGYFAVCTNQTSNFVSVFEILLNKTFPARSLISYPTNQLTIPPQLGGVVNISNFLHIELDINHQYIVFGIGTSVFSLRPLQYSSERLEDVRASACDRIHSLSPLAGEQFYIHCAEHLFTYDIGEEDWLLLDRVDQRGIPYVCPRGNAYLSVFSSYIEFTDSDNLRVTVELPGQAYSDGMCFGNATQSYFAFRDKTAGAFVLDLQSSEVTAVMTTACGGECYPLLALHQRYLIIRNAALNSLEANVLVWDFSENQTDQFERLRTRSLLATLLFRKCPPVDSTPTTKPPDGSGMLQGTGLIVVPEHKVDPPEGGDSSGNKMKVKVAVGAVAAIIAVLAVVIGGSVIIGVTLYYRNQKGK